MNHKLDSVQVSECKNPRRRNTWQGRIVGGKIAIDYGFRYFEHLRVSRKTSHHDGESNKCDAAT